MTDQTAAQFDQEAADYAAMDINPAAEIAAMMTPADADDPAPAATGPAAWDRKVITDARQLANARTHADIRAALTTLSPIHQADLIPDADLHTYAFGVTQEIIRTLAHMAERNA